jgi:Mn2+/Fe2+ NRAMP family transporter
MASFLAASIGTTTAEFAGLAAVGELFGIPRQAIVFAAFAGVVYLVVRGSYQRFEKVFVAMTVVYFSYVATAFIVTPDWLPVVRASIVPTLRLDPGYLFLLVGVIGTTVTSYMQFFIASAVSTKGARVADLPRLRTDVVLSTIFADLIALFIVVTTAETLFVRGVPVDSAAQAAEALAPLAGPYATQLFAIGIIGASLIGASVVPVSASFAVCEAFGWEHGMSQRFRDAPIFQGLFVAQLIIGGVIVLLPSVNLVGILVSTQVLDGVLLPITLIAIARLVSDQRLLGEFASRGLSLWILWLTAGLLSALSVLLLVVTVVAPI